MISGKHHEEEQPNRANARWMAGFGTVAMALGMALVVMFMGVDTLPADSTHALAAGSRTGSLGPMLTSIISPLLIFGGMALVLFSWLWARKTPGLF